MSEYQFYDFVALDRPLVEKQMAELRAISTRAEITATRFWNEYEWGHLKADPMKLVERYFDAHLYLTNWGTHRLVLRMPAAQIDAEALAPYVVGEAARLRVTARHALLDLCSEGDGADLDGESPGSLATLAPLRTDLMRGDLRVAYLAWLLAVGQGELVDEDTEPPVPPGLANLTSAQSAMVDFLRIDADLIAAAAEASEKDAGDRQRLRKWVLALPPRAKDAWLGRALDDPELALGAELQQAFRAQARPRGAERRRTVADLRALAERRRRDRARVEAARKARAKRTADAARERRLDVLAKRVDRAWTELEALVAKSAYDEAMKLATDLRHLARREGTSVNFATLFEAMRKRQVKRRGFFDRWKRQNEPDDEGRNGAHVHSRAVSPRARVNEAARSCSTPIARND